MMSRPEIVTFVLGSGAKVTAPRHLAERLGWTPEPETPEPETPGRRKK